MTELHTDIPENIQKHLQFVAKSFGLGQDEETVQALADSWNEKLNVFESKMIEMGMDEVGSFEVSDPRGALALTYSGSLVSIGPLMNGGRHVEYTSIGLRKDVPESVREDCCELKNDAEVEKCIEFVQGPLKRTSPIYKIVVCPESLGADEQEELVNEATTMIVDTFVEMNQDIY